MTDHPRAALVIPAYNAAATIADTLRSLDEQGDDLGLLTEVVLADDASRDDTVAVARAAWAGRVPLRVMAGRTNQGEGAVLSAAIASLPPEVGWVFILHADDEVKPGWLRAFVDRIAADDGRLASVCCNWDNWFPHEGRSEPGMRGDTWAVADVRRYPAGTESMRYTLILGGCWWHISGCAVRVDAYKQVGGRVPSFPQRGDWDLLLRMFSSGWDVEYLPVAYIRYRVHQQSVSGRSFRRHADISESLPIIRWHSWVLTCGEVVRLHLLFFYWLARRAVGAVVQRQPARLGWAVVQTASVAGGLVWTLGRRLGPPSRRDRVPFPEEVPADGRR